MNVKRALVTGAAKRLGREMALYLGAQGFDVAVHYNGSKAEADEVVARLKDMGRMAAACPANLLDEDETAALGPQAAKALGGPISVLVNNASIFEPDEIETATRKSWDRAIGSNLRAPFVLTQFLASQAPAPSTDANGEPRAEALIVNMIDQRVRKLTPDFVSYTIAKMGLWAFTQTSAQALAGRVRVNAIGPGPTMQGIRQSDAHFQNQRAASITGRGANPEDITHALGYFLGAHAVTGQLICVDGGQHLGWQTPDVLGPE
ncbi:MAG: SDR family oxidoreductase [Pseudomonadota bacterium]